MNSGSTYTAIIGSVIKKLRENKSISQLKMAENMGITQAAWSKLETGKSSLSIAQIAKIADILGVKTSKITEYADQVSNDLKNEGQTVAYDHKEATNHGLALLGTAAIATVVAFILLKRK